MAKTKLTLSVNKEILAAAKLEADKRHIPVSRLVENFLAFLANPQIYCFKCGERFYVSDAKVCPKCGWLICTKCATCGCNLGADMAAGLFHMRKVYEDLLAGKVK
ncbi:MAG: DUF6364 family protein [Candidatus Bathyarchaeia archaeon]